MNPPQDDAVLILGRSATFDDRILLTGEWRQADPPAELGALLLLSDDRGASWRQIPTPPQLANTFFDFVVGSEGGFVAYGSDPTAETSGWWESADGMVWAPARISGLSSFGPAPWAVAPGPGGQLAVGNRSAGNASVPAAWLSNDGHDWELVLDVEEPFGMLQGVAGGAHGYAACGSSYADRAQDPATGSATLWRSGDGRSWNDIALADDSGTGADCLAVNDEGVVAWVYGPVPDTGPAPTQFVFVPAGSDEIISSDLPVFAISIVALGNEFIGLAHCREQDGCSGDYLLIGTPSEEPPGPEPTLPPA